MRLLQLYNQYRSGFCGEDIVVRRIADLVGKKGGVTKLLLRDSNEIVGHLGRKVSAGLFGIYNYRAKAEVKQELQKFQPDIVHAHNLYPLFSPSVLVACRELNIPTVMSLHNFNLTCPNANHLCGTQNCFYCLENSPMGCITKNCRNNLTESMVYALRFYIAQKANLFEKNVDLFISMTKFSKDLLVRGGIQEKKIKVLYNAVDDKVTPPTHNPKGKYVAFAGRFDRVKGIGVLLEAAKQLKDIPFHLAGGGPLFDSMQQKAFNNVVFRGRLDKDEMNRFYSDARMLVVPSLWFDMCPLVISEGMAFSLPIIASDQGGISELVTDGKDGLLFTTGNATELAAKIATLWDNRELSLNYGKQARITVEKRFSEEIYYRDLAAIYNEAIGRKVFN